MRQSNFLVALPFILFLAACGQDVPTGIAFKQPPTPGGRLCTLQCGEAQDYCHKDCDIHDRTCTNEAQANAIRDYDAYTRAQFAAHADITLHPRDFEHREACETARKSCMDDCDKHYQTCFQNCGGRIETTHSCQSFCF